MDTKLDLFLPNSKTYLELLKEELIQNTILDGLDGSGKGTWATYVERYMIGAGVNVVRVEFPNYNTFLGEKIHTMLRSNKLELKERFSLFALNRLECVDEIRRAVEILYNINHRVVQVVFDRFSSSNLITLAYILSEDEDLKKIPDEQLENYINNPEVVDLKKMLGLMIEVDRFFHEILGIRLDKAEIWIPDVHHLEVIERIKNDETRVDSDNYEKARVQLIARLLYKKANQFGIYHFRFMANEKHGTSPLLEVSTNYFKRKFADDEEGTPLVYKIDKIENTNYSREVLDAMDKIKSNLNQGWESQLEP